MSKCKYCGAEIEWIKTPAGKYMPCDAQKVEYTPNPVGSRTIITPRGEVVRGYFLTDNLAGNPNNVRTGYIPHWVTCNRQQVNDGNTNNT